LCAHRPPGQAPAQRPPQPPAEPLPPGVRRLTGADSDLAALAFTHDGTGVVAAGRNGTLRRWELATSESKATRPVNLGDELSSMALTPDDRTAAVSGVNGVLRLVDLGSGRVRAALAPRSGFSLWAVALSPDGRTLASAHGTNEVRLWDVGQSDRDGQPQPGGSDPGTPQRCRPIRDSP
jgi:WD40 repeat protein